MVKISKIKVTIIIDKKGNKKVYKVKGQLIFALATNFLEKFDFDDKLDCIEIYLSKAHVWGESGIGAIDKVCLNIKKWCKNKYSFN
ncbi:hypothetical protein [Clostridium brassicae]|uniref:Uncharacterized protein n=1 Tax=Clostridium brassicae TaxID=2999072 RepID=A0ABT4D654_9CLOT|nr:hypothetical protein [Clostridium brassicae]MCY6957778.1 hypothetical protein [Clostridium brassicae]